MDWSGAVHRAGLGALWRKASEVVKVESYYMHILLKLYGLCGAAVV